VDNQMAEMARDGVGALLEGVNESGFHRRLRKQSRQFWGSADD
jgi:hypothetical protein